MTAIKQPPCRRASLRSSAVSIEVMDTRGDFDVTSLIFGPRTPAKKKGKQSTTGSLRAPAASTFFFFFFFFESMAPEGGPLFKLIYDK